MHQHCLSRYFLSSHKSKHATITLGVAEAQPGIYFLAVGGPEVVGVEVAGAVKLIYPFLFVASNFGRTKTTVGKKSRLMRRT